MSPSLGGEAFLGEMINFFFTSVTLRDLISYVVEMRALDVVSALTLWKRTHYCMRHGHISKLPRLLNTFFLAVILLPLSITYFFWIHIPMMIYSLFCGYIILLLQVISRRSKLTKRILIHVSALSKIGTITLKFSTYSSEEG